MLLLSDHPLSVALVSLLYRVFNLEVACYKNINIHPILIARVLEDDLRTSLESLDKSRAPRRDISPIITPYSTITKVIETLIPSPQPLRRRIYPQFSLPNPVSSDGPADVYLDYQGYAKLLFAYFRIGSLNRGLAPYY